MTSIEPNDYRAKESELEKVSKVEPKINYLGRALTFVGMIGMYISTIGLIYELNKHNSSADYNEIYYAALVTISGFTFAKGLKQIIGESKNSGLEDKVENKQ